MILSTESAQICGKTLLLAASVSVEGDSKATVNATVCDHLFAGTPKRLLWSSFEYRTLEVGYVIQCQMCQSWFKLKPIEVVQG